MTRLLTMLTVLALGVLLLSPGRSAAGPKEDAEAAYAKMQAAGEGAVLWLEAIPGPKADAMHYGPGGKRDILWVAGINGAAIANKLDDQEEKDLDSALYWFDHWLEGGLLYEDAALYWAYDATLANTNGQKAFADGDFAGAKTWFEKAEVRYNSTAGWAYDSYCYYSWAYPEAVTADWLITKAGF